MSRAVYRSQRAELAALRAEMAKLGASVSRVAAMIRVKLNVNSRVAFRHAHGLTNSRSRSNGMRYGHPKNL